MAAAVFAETFQEAQARIGRIHQEALRRKGAFHYRKRSAKTRKLTILSNLAHQPMHPLSLNLLVKVQSKRYAFCITCTSTVGLDETPLVSTCSMCNRSVICENCRTALLCMKLCSFVLEFGVSFCTFLSFGFACSSFRLHAFLFPIVSVIWIKTSQYILAFLIRFLKK